jgi:UDP-2-acetamido-2,6-beta-L-arabino-hexul-4-ose reductase
MRNSNILERVGTGLVRSLYSTYISYLPQQKFSYPVKIHDDLRGRFVEMLKTQDSGQFSYFTVLPNITRGEHYHHSKTEKFLVIKGNARFKFYHLHTAETYELIVNGDKPKIVESIPGWAHNIKNIGNDEMVVMIWANENFDPSNPDTFSYQV